ncbi:MAG: DUF192 domain-containing protein [Candidatus Aenigmarchaeota archaeon]|nr:DUF192 domain-containing protein [Candidatus Aenigmarchaeota archaeon]
MGYRKGTVVVGGRTLQVSVALGISKMRGMMFRTWADVHGMLFPFPYAGKWGVEMPFCPNMDVVFLDSEKRVIEVQSARPWGRDPRTWKIYRPAVPCKYVLELPSGHGAWFRKGARVVLNL